MRTALHYQYCPPVFVNPGFQFIIAGQFELHFAVPQNCPDHLVFTEVCSRQFHISGGFGMDHGFCGDGHADNGANADTLYTGVVSY